MIDYHYLRMLAFVIIYAGLCCLYHIIKSLMSKKEKIIYMNNREKPKHLWGYSDTEFMCHNGNVVLTGDRYLLCNQELPYFIPFIRDKIGELYITDKRKTNNLQDIYDEIAMRPKHLLFDSFLEQIISNEKFISYSTQPEDRLYHSHGQLCVDEIYELMYGNKKFNVVDIVIYPSTKEHLMNLFKISDEYEQGNIKFIPFGGGTNVTKCLEVDDNWDELYVSIDMKYFNELISLDETNYVAVLGAGMTGEQIEKNLNKRGFTMGHEPDSYEFSTLGGWISTYASGMKRGKYGNIEDIVLGFEGVSPSGYWNCHHLTPGGENVLVRSSQGIDPKYLFFGSEGNLGVITYVTVKVRLLPKVKKYQSVVFKKMSYGLDFLAELHDSEAVPASIRLVDNYQFQMSQALKPRKTGFVVKMKDKLTKFYLKYIRGFDFDKMVAATIVFEGSKETVAYQEMIIEMLAKTNKGIIGGAENGKAGYLLTNAIAYIRDFVNCYDIIAETFETSCVWDDILPMTDKMNAKLDQLYKFGFVKTKPFMTYRVTQLYNSGVCLYFTLAIHHTDSDICSVYNFVEKEMRNIMKEFKTSVSHHHGIGKLKKNLLITDEIMTHAIKNVKLSLDPKNMMNAKNNIF